MMQDEGIKLESPQPSSLALCDICARLPYNAIFHPFMHEKPTDFELGRITSIRNKASSCHFCWFVTKIHDNTLISFWTESRQSRSRSKEPIYLTTKFSAKHWYEVAGVEAARPKGPTAWLQYGAPQELQPTEPCVCISAVQNNLAMNQSKCDAKASLPASEIGYSLPRRRTDQERNSGLINYDLIRSWIGICQERHTEMCGESISFKRQLLRVKLIDVHRREIVTVDGDYRYVALSYVRGSVSTKHGTKISTALPTRTQLLQVSSADTMSRCRLPKTIENAMTFVKALGETYLWVDLLCIDQEDDSGKQKQIENMDLVYECAYLTLIALDGKDFDAGLAGIARPLKQIYQPLVDLDDIRLMATFVESVWDNHGSAPWDYRAWTFQEGLLSRRSLIFDKRQILMRCWQEIFHDTMEVDHGTQRIPTDQGHVFFWENGWGIDLYQNVFTFSALDVFVANYSRRELTLQSDALNACRGALSQITRHTGVGFIWGLPHVDLTRALLWKPHQDYCILQRQGFPSWSWLGWIGRTEYSYWLNEIDDYEDQAKDANTKRAKLDHGDLHSIDAALVAQNHEAFVVIKGVTESSQSLTVSSTIARFDLKMVRKQGSTLKHLKSASQQNKIAIGDHWTLLDRDGKPLRNMVGECSTFEETDHFFHLHPHISRAIRGNRVDYEFLFMRYWRSIRDHHASNNWLRNMVSALLIIRNQDESAWRVASVVMKLEDWIAADPQPAVVVLN